MLVFEGITHNCAQPGGLAALEIAHKNWATFYSVAIYCSFLIQQPECIECFLNGRLVVHFYKLAQNGQHHLVALQGKQVGIDLVTVIVLVAYGGIAFCAASVRESTIFRQNTGCPMFLWRSTTDQPPSYIVVVIVILIMVHLFVNVPPSMKNPRKPKAQSQNNAQAHVQTTGIASPSRHTMESHS